MKKLINFSLVLFFFIAITQWGQGFLASLGTEYRLYRLRDPFVDVNYVMRVARTFDSLDRVLTYFGFADSPKVERPSESAGCKLMGREVGEVAFELDISAAECRQVENVRGDIAIFYVEYPSMKIVKSPGRLNESLIVFRLTHVSPDRYDENATIKNLTPFCSADRIEYYQFGQFVRAKFVGADGRGVFVNKMFNTTSVGRLFNKRLHVQYQYLNVGVGAIVDVKKIDGLVLHFLRETIIE